MRVCSRLLDISGKRLLYPRCLELCAFSLNMHLLNKRKNMGRRGPEYILPNIANSKEIKISVVRGGISNIGSTCYLSCKNFIIAFLAAPAEAVDGINDDPEVPEPPAGGAEDIAEVPDAPQLPAGAAGPEELVEAAEDQMAPEVHPPTDPVAADERPTCTENTFMGGLPSFVDKYQDAAKALDEAIAENRDGEYISYKFCLARLLSTVVYVLLWAMQLML